MWEFPRPILDKFATTAQKKARLPSRSDCYSCQRWWQKKDDEATARRAWQAETGPMIAKTSGLSPRLAALALLLWLVCGPALATEESPVDLVVVIENAVSTGSVDPQRQLAAHMGDWLATLPANVRVALIAYDDLALPMVPLTRLRDGGGEQVRDALQSLDFAAQRTNSAAGLERAIHELTQAPGGHMRRLIVLQHSSRIDVGDVEKNRAFRRWAVDVLADKAADAGIELVVVSLGSKTDTSLSTALARRASGIVLEAATPTELPGVMSRLNRHLADTGQGLADRTEPTRTALPVAIPASQPTVVDAPARVADTTPAIKATPPDPQTPPAPTRTDVEALEGLAAPAAGPVVSAAAAKEAVSRSGWRLPALTLDSPIWLGAAIATIALLLALVTLGYARRRRHDRPARADATGAVRLIDISGATNQRTYVLDGKLARISREAGPETDNVVTVQVPHDVISRSHAFIELRRGAYWVTDPGSNNGTFVNGKRISGSHRLAHGDRIAFANFEFCFESDARDASAEAGGTPDTAAATQFAEIGAADRTTLAPQQTGPGRSGGLAHDGEQDHTIVRPMG